MTRLPLLLGLLAVTVVPAPAADPAVPPEARTRAEELVRALGSPAFSDRDRATRELRKLGRLALPALIAARRDDNPEVRMRAAWLLPTAESDAVRVRLEAFLADEDGTTAHDLPGWPQFRRVAGADRSARELFAEAVRDPLSRRAAGRSGRAPADAAGGLAAAAGGLAAAGPEQASPTAVGRAVVARRLQMYGQYGPQSARGGAAEPRTCRPWPSSAGRGADHRAGRPADRHPVLHRRAVRPAGGRGGGGRVRQVRPGLPPAGRPLAGHPGRPGLGVPGVHPEQAAPRLPAADQAEVRRPGVPFPGLSWMRKLEAIAALGQTREAKHLTALTKNFTDQSALPRRGGAGDAIQVRDVAWRRPSR
ncbi:MAG: hypothetical protein U0871_23040 [Gemmataceae bacterium]